VSSSPPVLDLTPAGPTRNDGRARGRRSRAAREASSERYDVIVVGSGFGGAMAAAALVAAGRRVLMLECGAWVRRGTATWRPEGTLELTPHRRNVAQRAGGDGGGMISAASCVGGASVFYGGVSLRYREHDFEPQPEIVGESGAAWPFGYDELEPHYAAAERLLDVAGARAGDPSAPWRSTSYPQRLPPLSAVSERLRSAAESLGLQPFRLPLAINYRSVGSRSPCLQCRTCDTFACAVAAKNDLATAVLPRLLSRGLTLLTGVSARRLVTANGRVRHLEAEGVSGELLRLRATHYFLAAGALTTPQLLLASGLDQLNPAGASIGRYLTRHCAAIVMGVFPRPPDGERRFHKELGIHDLYDGAALPGAPRGRLGGLQQVATPPLGLLRRELPVHVRRVAGPLRDRLTGLLVMAEDQPHPGNRVALSRSGGHPRGVVEHRHSERDRQARDALVRVATRILRHAGAVHCHVHPIPTFSHALGTVRMGIDPRRAPLDGEGRFRGVENLFVVDGSALPRSAAVNPSLTIAAHSLRTAAHALELPSLADLPAAA